MINAENLDMEQSRKRKLSDEVSSDSNIVEKESQCSESDHNTNITKLGQVEEPVRIFLFPPTNKHFKVDESTQLISLEPIENDAPKEKDVEEMVLPDFSLAPLNKNDNCLNQCNAVDMVIKKHNVVDSNETMMQKPVSHNVQELEDVSKNLSNEETSHKLVCRIEKPFLNSKLKEKCFLKGCKWSPDGYCLVSCSDDNMLRLFEFSEKCLKDFQEGTFLDNDSIQPVLQMKEGGTIYDYAWYPKMKSTDPISCVLASTSQDAPIHLWDAYTGHVRATYQPINQFDEITPAYSLCFSPDGSKLYCGFKKCIRIFDLNQPGRFSEQRSLKVKEEPAFQANIISCIAVNPAFQNLYALGSYDKTIGIYLEPSGELQCLLKGHVGGVTQLLFSPDGLRLYSGARKDPEILCWDLRNPGQVLFTVKRTSETNQRIYFDLAPDGAYFFTGSTDGIVKGYNTKADGSFLNPCVSWKAHNDCTNGVSFHPFYSLVATSSGQRHFILPDDMREENQNEILDIENSIKIWFHERSL